MTSKRIITFWLGIIVSLFFMVILLRKMDFNQLVSAFKTADYRYIFFAVIFTFANYLVRAVRWRYLLICEKSLPLSSLYPATIIGYMANNILPARLGELVRAYMLAQKEKLPVPMVVASLVMDRLFDGFTVMLILVLTLFTIHLPPEMAASANLLRTGGAITFLLYVLLVIFLLLLKWQTLKTIELTAVLLKPFPKSFSKWLIPLLGSFISGIKLSRKSGHIGILICSSLIIWIFCIVPVDMILKGFGIHLPWSASMFILVLLVFAVMVPASPGFIGTYHYACYRGLATFGVEESLAISVAIVLHGTSFFPVIFAGFYHLWRSKLSLQEVGKTVGEEV